MLFGWGRFNLNSIANLSFCVFKIILFSGGENFVALDLIVQHVHSQLEKVRTPQSVSVTESGTVNRILLTKLYICLSYSLLIVNLWPLCKGFLAKNKK